MLLRFSFSHSSILFLLLHPTPTLIQASILTPISTAKPVPASHNDVLFLLSPICFAIFHRHSTAVALVYDFIAGGDAQKRKHAQDLLLQHHGHCRLLVVEVGQGASYASSFHCENRRGLRREN